MNSINDYLPKPHPTKAVFKKHQFPVSAVAKYLQLNTNYVSSMLSGHLRISPANEAKLRQLANHIERGGVPNG